MQTMNEIKHRMNYGRERNHYTARPSNADVCTVDGGYFEETGALLFYSPSDVRRRGLPHWRGGLQSVTSEYPHTSGLSGQRNDSLLQNRRQDTLQAKRHTSHARKTLLPNTQETMATIDEKRKAVLEQAIRDMGNYGVKLRKPEELPDFDQPVDYEEEKKRFEPVKVEEQNDKESNKDYSQPSYQETELSPTERATSTEENHQRVGKTRDRKQLSEFQGKYLQPFRNSHRKAVYVSEETQRKLDFVVRKIGEQGASVSGYVEQVLQEHLDQYKDDVERWRKL